MVFGATTTNRIVGQAGRLSVGASPVSVSPSPSSSKGLQRPGTAGRGDYNARGRARDIHPEIAGDGPERKAIEAAMAREGVGSRIELAGTPTKFGEWLAGWSVFVSSYAREGQSLALLGALTAGLPCVVNAVRGATGIVAAAGDGIVVLASDPEALAEGARCLLENEQQRSAAGQTARERAIRNCSIRYPASRQCYVSVHQANRASEAA
jgi:glycosyltransferase involved in cell wall biosynthesis